MVVRVAQEKGWSDGKDTPPLPNEYRGRTVSVQTIHRRHGECGLAKRKLVLSLGGVVSNIN